MRLRLSLVCGSALALLALAGCNLPGKPTAADIVHRPTDNLDAVKLYGANCAGCHGADGKLGPAPPIGDPLYLAIVDDDTLRTVITKGRPGTPMSAFAQSEGGMLTSAQVDAIVKGIRQRWGKPDVLQGGTAPSYAAKSRGNPQQGAAGFATYCAGCHGKSGEGSGKVGSIVAPSYLALITDQGLRTITIIGRPDFNAPDWRNNVPGHPMSDQEITDVVAWLASQRPAGVVTASSASEAPSSTGADASRRNPKPGSSPGGQP
ncbi:MAG TPA: c-type cytochrome [Bryocella sp.]|nr:c-type cytochrome [Bryocella sp.]